jgi:hypothetical protein
MQGKALVSKKFFIPLALLLWLLVSLSFTLLIPRAEAYDPATGCPANNDEAMDGVYSPNRFRIYNLCQQVTGTVTFYEEWSDGDWNVYVNNLTNPSLWNEAGRKNLRAWDQAGNHGYGSADMIWEAIPRDHENGGLLATCTPSSPRSEAELYPITVYGVYVTDKWHGWREIHPITQVTHHGQTCTREPTSAEPSEGSEGGGGQCKETWGWGGRNRC